MNPMNLRIGEGWDVHALVPGRRLMLGGVEIAHTHGLLGRLFPDDDPAYRGADSAVLLREAMQRVRAHGWQLVNLDCTVVAQAPRLSGHMPAIVQRVADCLSIPTAQVNVKAKTAERLGPVGQGHSIEARAVVLLAHV
jgi:2-C-methyl-D-erythritol 2,4-cyclodiphosphate synthase